ncbi:hypothetical protein [Bacteroides pyogenes]|uniref:Uncharacterized protein n=1 Tax=Bacteroides pyogenes TaxID=310300 RepID=A0A5D3EAJ9_9BACE|nr:hypothetical protein [Bacteroides pyogenes]TYK32818.1 hypothetical protein FNJ60_10430 [Bacteroides pyogenes]
MKKFFLSVLLIPFIFVSCKDQEIIERVPENPLKGTRVSGINVEELSDEQKYELQSSPEGILMNQIVCEDFRFFLNMSREEARDLNIPDSLYQAYLEIVENLNSIR